MFFYCVLAFFAGGLVGMLGMATLAYGSKVNLIREMSCLKQQLDMMEKQPARRGYRTVKDPRPEVNSLIN